MTTISIPVSASVPVGRPIWRTKILLSVLLFMLLYSVFVLVQEWGFETNKKTLMSHLPTLRALLFENGNRLDLYDSHAVLIRSAQENALENAIVPRLLSTRAVLSGDRTSPHVRDLASPYSYSPVATDQQNALLHLSRATNFTYSIPEDADGRQLQITFAACGQIASIPLPMKERWYDAPILLRTFGLPMQQKMALSPAETSLALMNHSNFPRIVLVRLIDRRSLALSVPSFDPEQLHFSPFFIEDQTLLFSVLDRNHWGTARYHLQTGMYEMVSEHFTDQAYHSLSGETILRQSFFDETVNVPFGSVTLLEQIRGIPAREIEGLTGPKENNPAVFSLLFQDPKASSLHYKTNLTTQSFNAIAESDLREHLRTFWLARQLRLSHAVGVFRLLRLNADDSLSDIDTIPFESRPAATFTQFVEDAEPLLRALALPSTLIEEYRKRSAAAKDKGEEYRLVDDLSY